MALLALFAGLAMTVEVAFVPWARSFGLWPTLTGSWVSAPSPADGRASFVYVELTGGAGYRGRPYINGRALWCEPGGTIHDYEIFGSPDNWRGTVFHLSTRSVVERPFGRLLSQLRGQWNGDEIRAEGLVISGARVATAEAVASSSALTTAPPDVRPYVLRRGREQEFVAACTRLNP
jgi:hypothetical protein